MSTETMNHVLSQQLALNKSSGNKVLLLIKGLLVAMRNHRTKAIPTPEISDAQLHNSLMNAGIFSDGLASSGSFTSMLMRRLR